MKIAQRGQALVWIIVIAIILFIGVGFLIYSKPQVSEKNSDTTHASTTPQAITTVGQIRIYLYALDDNGKTGLKFGCNDSLVPVTLAIPPTQAPLKAALEKLFSLTQMDYGQSGLKTALYQSHLNVESVSVQNGIASVKLSGQVQLGGVCDDPRFVNQIKYTVLQFPTVKLANITINDKSLESFGSEK